MDGTDGDRTGRETALSRRRLLAATGTVSATLVAGCSDGGEGDGSETDDGETDGSETDDGGMDGSGTDDGETDGGMDGEETTSTDEPTSDASGTVSSSVSSLSIVEHRPRVGYFRQTEQTYFPVEVTVENGGDQQTNVTAYYYDVAVYDADGNDVTGGQSGSSSDEETQFGPGQQASLVVYSTIDVQPSDVARYEVEIVCESSVTGFEAEGVYCQ